MRFYNTRIKNQPFELDLHPQYSFKEDAYVGFSERVIVLSIIKIQIIYINFVRQNYYNTNL